MSARTPESGCGHDQEQIPEQVVWDAVRKKDWLRPALEAFNVAGPDDMNAALSCEELYHEGDGTAEDMPIYVGEIVLHTLAAEAGDMQQVLKRAAAVRAALLKALNEQRRS